MIDSIREVQIDCAWDEGMTNTRIFALAVIHCAGGVLSAVMSADEPAVSSAILFAFVFSQSSLVGIWCGLGRTHYMVRLLVAFVISMCLWVELGLGIDEFNWRSYFLVVVSTSIVGLGCWVIRLVWAPLRTESDSVGRNTEESLQFSIRHLMALTLVVACLLTIGRLLAPFVRGLDLLAQLSVLGVCYATVALSALWATLGLRHAAVRSVVVILISVAAGLVAGYVLDRGNDFVFWTSTAVLQAALLIGSLLVIRSVGYRLLK